MRFRSPGKKNSGGGVSSKLPTLEGEEVEGRWWDEEEEESEPGWAFIGRREAVALVGRQQQGGGGSSGGTGARLRRGRWSGFGAGQG